MKYFLFPDTQCEQVYAYLGMRPAAETERLRRIFDDLQIVDPSSLQAWKQAFDDAQNTKDNVTENGAQNTNAAEESVQDSGVV